MGKAPDGPNGESSPPAFARAGPDAIHLAVEGAGAITGHGFEVNDKLDGVLAAAVEVINLQGGQVQFPAGGCDLDLGIEGDFGEGGGGGKSSGNSPVNHICKRLRQN